MYMQVDVPMARPPVANWLLIAVNTIVTLALFAADSKFERSRARGAQFPEDPEVERQLDDPRVPEARKQQLEAQEEKRFAEWEAANAGRDEPPSHHYALRADRKDFHVWQLITYQFVHGNFLHLLGNMLFLFCFGNAVNAKIGQGLFLGLYLLLGAIAGVGWLVLGSAVPLVGASGAIMGITGLFLVLYPLNEIAVWTFRSVIYTGDAWRFPSWVFIAFYMALDLFGTVFDRNTGGGGVAYICHLVGAFAGIAFGCALVAARWVTSDRGEQNLLEAMGMIEEPKPRPRKKRRRPKPPPPNPVPEL